MTNIEKIAKHIGDWYRAGDIGGCDVGGCVEEATKFAEIRKEEETGKDRAVDTWYFCGPHFAEYLRLADEIRQEKRSAATA